MSGFRGGAAVGIPPGVKEGGRRTDFKTLNSENDTDFDFLIETKCPRFAWARSCVCPCVGPNAQAVNRPSPTCELCEHGRLYFSPANYVVNTATVGTLTEVQTALINAANAAVIKALLVGANATPDLYNVLGQWALGRAAMTTRQQNRLGYYDRLLAIDDRMVFSENLTVGATSTMRPRYPVVAINFARTETAVLGESDLEISNGSFVWKDGRKPAEGVRVAVHYLCVPVWVVEEFTKLSRVSLVKQKKLKTTTPEGDVVFLPGQVIVRLEHLPPLGYAP